MIFDLHNLGAIQKVCHRPRGEGVKQNSDKQWQGGRGVQPNSDVTAYDKIVWQYSKLLAPPLLIFCDNYQLSNCILFEFIFV